MRITLSNIGKRYNTEWIFRKVSTELAAGEHCVFLGSNGSGKSTLLQVVAGNIIPSEGEIRYEHENASTGSEDIYRYISFASPYLDLFEEYTLRELAAFHSKFKPFYHGIDVQRFIALVQLEKSADKPLRNYSSGMKQRVRLALAILSDTPLLLLDEPASNLDKKSIEWYNHLVQDHSANRLIIVCSNQQPHEYSFCRQELQIENYK
jgi:ABC-type multidrug transport system ATPase subunit